MIQTVVQIMADNPPSILIVAGVGLHLIGDPLGFLLILAGIGLNVAWLAI